MADPTPTATVDPPAAPEAPPAPAPEPTPADEPFDKDRAMATITKLRDAEKAGKAAAKERDELASRLQAIEDAQKSEAQKAAERLAALEAKEQAWAAERQTYNLKLAIYAKQAELGIVDPDLALLALDRSTVEFDKQGEPTNVTEALNALLEQRPILKGKAQAPPAPRINPGAGTQTDGPTPALTAEELAVATQAGMSPEEYAQAKTATTVTDWQTKGAPATA